MLTLPEESLASLMGTELQSSTEEKDSWKSPTSAALEQLRLSKSRTQAFSSMSFQRVHIHLLLSSPPAPPTLNPMTFLSSLCAVLGIRKAGPQITAEGKQPEKVTHSEGSQVTLSQTRVPSTTQKMDFAELFVHSRNALCV